jgi:hypothetical protein
VLASTMLWGAVSHPPEAPILLADSGLRAISRGSVQRLRLPFRSLWRSALGPTAARPAVRLGRLTLHRLPELCRAEAREPRASRGADRAPTARARPTFSRRISLPAPGARFSRAPFEELLRRRLRRLCRRSRFDGPQPRLPPAPPSIAIMRHDHGSASVRSSSGRPPVQGSGPWPSTPESCGSRRACDRLFSGPPATGARFLDGLVTASTPPIRSASGQVRARPCASATGCSRSRRLTPAGSAVETQRRNRRWRSPPPGSARSSPHGLCRADPDGPAIGAPFLGSRCMSKPPRG